MVEQELRLVLLRPVHAHAGEESFRKLVILFALCIYEYSIRTKKWTKAKNRKGVVNYLSRKDHSQWII